MKPTKSGASADNLIELISKTAPGKNNKTNGKHNSQEFTIGTSSRSDVRVNPPLTLPQNKNYQINHTEIQLYQDNENKQKNQ